MHSITGPFAQKKTLICFLTFPPDFVLVYEEDMEALEKRKNDRPGPPEKKDKSKMTSKDKAEMWRNKFTNNLRKAGLEMEEVKYLILLFTNKVRLCDFLNICVILVDSTLQLIWYDYFSNRMLVVDMEMNELKRLISILHALMKTNALHIHVLCCPSW